MKPKASLAPPEKIDDGWHHFILFTANYASFCTKHFGRFIHHRPFNMIERTSQDGTIARQTIAFARKIFGDLSPNWNRGLGDCDNCEGSTNCQDTCAKQ